MWTHEMTIVYGLYVIVGALLAAWAFSATSAWNEVCIVTLKMLRLESHRQRFVTLLTVFVFLTACVLFYVVAWPVLLLLGVCNVVRKRLFRNRP